MSESEPFTLADIASQFAAVDPNFRHFHGNFLVSFRQNSKNLQTLSPVFHSKGERSRIFIPQPLSSESWQNSLSLNQRKLWLSKMDS